MSGLLPSDVFLCLTSHKSCGNPTTPLVTGSSRYINKGRMVLPFQHFAKHQSRHFSLEANGLSGTPTIFTANVATLLQLTSLGEKKITMTVDASFAKFTDLSSSSGIQRFSSPYATVGDP